MNETEKNRAQRNAQRTVAGRATAGASRTQAVLQHLGIELYRERKRSEREQSGAGRSEGTAPDRRTG